MLRPLALACISLPLLAIPSLAAAETLFPTMGADGSSSSLGAQVALMDTEGEGELLKRLDLNGQYVTEKGTGGYASLAMTNIEDTFVLGGLEAGALYRRDSGTSSYTLRAGLVLPTDTADSLEEFFLQVFSAMGARPRDYVNALPDTTSLRVAASPSVNNGNFVARADVGLDIPVAGDGADEGNALVHAELGAGVQAPQGAALVEFSTLSDLDSMDVFFHMVALTGELHAGKTTPYLTISHSFQTGLDEDDGGAIFSLDFTNVVLGVRGQI